MIDGFVKVDKQAFSEVWSRIKNKVDAVESNWAEGKKGVRPIIIKWGYKDASSGEKIILAVTRADDDGDEHWVDETILAQRSD
jgi:hypothetical protein